MITIIELDYVLIYNLNNKVEAHTTTVEKGKVPYVREGYGVMRLTREQYNKYNSIPKLVKR